MDLVEWARFGYERKWRVTTPLYCRYGHLAFIYSGTVAISKSSVVSVSTKVGRIDWGVEGEVTMTAESRTHDSIGWLSTKVIKFDL